jgi:hypothetical protein
MTGALEKELNTYIKKLNTDQKKSLLQFIKTIFSGKEEEAMTVEQYNKELDEAVAELERGESYTHEEAIEIFKRVIHAPR